METQACMPVTAVRMARVRNADGDLVVRLGVRLLDEYLEFLAGRYRPKTCVSCAGLISFYIITQMDNDRSLDATASHNHSSLRGKS
jgi:hypothetical protein